MKKEVLNRLNTISTNIDKAKVESIKSQLYFDGYLDCIKDLISGENSYFLEILEKKSAGKARQEAYNDISDIISDLKTYVSNLSDQQSEQQSSHSAIDHSIHPNERAQRFLDRIAKEKEK